ncbi:CBS domain-containing protein [Asanoa sp. NPDC050611]|uniref:CBS domain-containing protein n=1 Tax=Asanoa sp. NPDC050611 TaxID=3157098 RepID=UPI0033EA67A3
MRQWRVRDVMTADVVSTTVDRPAHEVLAALDAHHLSAMPVVDDRGHVVGMVSRTDLLPSVRSRPTDVEHVMTTPVWTVVPETTLPSAAKQMRTGKVKRLPVTGEAGRLVGIVSATDLLRVFSRLDTDIREDVLAEVAHTTRWIDREPVHVVVRDGVVTLVGTLDRRSTVMIAERLARTVPGVVSVVNRLEFEYDDTAAIRARDDETGRLVPTS